MIKELDKSYAGKIVKLHKKSIFPIWRRFGRKYSIRETREYIGLVLKKGKIFGYFVDNKLVGCGGIIINKKHKVGEIHLVLVDPMFQKQGIGKKIIEHIEKYSQNKVDKLRLNVLIKNPAVEFYEKLRYKKHACIMEKKIK